MVSEDEPVEHDDEGVGVQAGLGVAQLQVPGGGVTRLEARGIQHIYRIKSIALVYLVSGL